MNRTAALVCAAALLAAGVASADRRGGRHGEVEEEAGHAGAAAPAPATSAAAAAGDPGKALFEEKCKLCHGLDRPLDQRKDRIGWTTTVMRMKETNGCPISESEADQIIAYLARIRGPEGR